MAVLTPEQETYLKEHSLGVLATGRKDGSPQVSTIVYALHEGEVIISVTSDRAKWINAMRQPKVSMVVLDGRKQLVLYGEARGIEHDPPRQVLHKVIRAAMGRPVENEIEYLELLDKQKRVILAITPTKVLYNE